jgi:hypothetical protein
MIRHLRHNEIDKGAWDALLARSGHARWYARSRVLDLAAPGWEALVDTDAGAIMPLTWRRKWCVDYLFNPYGLQQLGVFAPVLDAALSEAFLAAIPGRFRYVDIWLNEAMAPSAQRGAQLMPQRNQVLRAPADAIALRAAYAEGHRRNLRKGSPPAMITGGIDPAGFIDLFERTTGKRYGGSPPGSLPRLQAVIADALAEGTGNITGVHDGTTLVAAICTITWGGRSILLKSANDERGQAMHAMFHLVDHWIATHAGTGVVLDFAGSNTPGVARFNAGFGATATTYIRFRWNRLPWPFRYMRP